MEKGRVVLDTDNANALISVLSNIVQNQLAVTDHVHEEHTSNKMIASHTQMIASHTRVCNFTLAFSLQNFDLALFL